MYLDINNSDATPLNTIKILQVLFLVTSCDLIALQAFMYLGLFNLIICHAWRRPEAGSPELLLLLPFISPVKMQKLVLEAPDKDQAPTSLRLFRGQA